MSGPTLDPALDVPSFAYGSVTLFARTFQSCSTKSRIPSGSPQPRMQASGLASFPFARRYLENRVCFLFLRVLRCFSSPRCLSMRCLTHASMPDHYIRRVPPFGYLRVTGYVLLTAAFRSLSRPSSAPSAKASTLCSFLLGLSYISVRLGSLAIYGAHIWAFSFCQ